MEPSKQPSNIDDGQLRLRNAELFVAIGKGKLNKVKGLLESGVKTDTTDKNNKDNTPLHYAVENDKTEIVAELLDPKWETNINLKNAQGSTALEIAQHRANQEIIQLLQNHRIEVGDESRNVETDENETGKQEKKCSLNFRKTKGAAGIEGQLCEINLAIWLLLKGKSDEQLKQFYLASNVEMADKFDDIVFRYKNEAGTWKTIFLQSKHKTGGQEKNNQRVQLTGLLSNSEKGDFSLNKYFISYRKIKQQFLNNRDPGDPIFSGNFDDCEFILYTNAPFEYGKSTSVQEIVMEDHDLFRIKDSQGKFYQIVFDSDEKQQIFDILKNSSDCRRLAKALAEAFHSKKGLDIQKGIFQTYHKALREKVLVKTEDSYGKLSDVFLSDDENQFPLIFFEEAATVFKKSVDEIKQQLTENKLKLSSSFWNKTPKGFSQLPNDDPIAEHEVDNFLNKFKLYANQPNEKDLENVIKEIAANFYNIENQDIDPVFADVANKVKNWWKDKSNYIMKDNRFFEDALRISVEFDVIEPVASFTGRTQALVDLHRMLQEGGAVSISQIATITGLGGIGKSETARKYLSMYKNNYDNNIIWINAENQSTIRQSFQKLAQDKLKISIIDEDNKEKDTKLLTQEVYNFFAKMHRKSIFVFDNAEKLRQENEYVDKLLPEGLNKPYVIITTRNQTWDGMMKLSLGLFTQEEAETFIKNSLKEKIEIEDHELKTLTKELDCLPLALRQAVAYISVENDRMKKWSNKQFTISCYLDEFHKHADRLLGSGVIRNHTQTVMTTWKTSIEKIKLESEKAIEILQVIAYLAPDQIPVDEVFVTEESHQDEIRSATELLEQYSMIRIAGGNVSIHRLVQTVTRIEMETTEKNEQTLDLTFTLITASYPYGSQKMDDILKKQRMSPHFEALVSHFDNLMHKKEWVEIENKYYPILLHNMADGYAKDPERQKQLLERVLAIEENSYGPDHVDVAITLGNLGNAYGKLGDAKKKKELLEHALQIMEAYYGPDHLDVATTLGNLANAYGALGDAPKQKELLERALIINEAQLGHNHIELAIILENLGIAYGDLGDTQKKKELLERALQIMEAYYGPDHFDVATTLGNLANAYGALGDAPKQKELLERALIIDEAYYGSDHFQVAATLTNLGNAYGDFGDAQKKKELLERAQKIFENYYGPDHFKVAITLVNLGVAYGNLGDVQKKKELLERALTIDEPYYGSDHFKVAVILENLGVAYGDLGDDVKQKQLLQRALIIKENCYGPDHLEVAKTLGNLGNAYGKLGDAQKMKELLERALIIQENCYRPDHFQVAITIGNLGVAYGKLGDAQKQKELLERALLIKEAWFGTDHFEVAITLVNLGNAYGDLGDAQKEKELLERTLKIEEAYYGPDHFHVAITLENLGNAYGDLGYEQKKKELLERALKIKEAYYGPDHFSVAITLTNLGNARGALGDAQKMKELLERALVINEAWFGPDHTEVARTLGNLGVAYGRLGDAQKKKDLLERALPITEAYYGPDHIQVAITLGNLANAYGDLGDAQKKKDLLERALTIEETYYGPDHFEVATTLTNLGNAYGAFGDTKKMKEMLERALIIKEAYYGSDHFQVAIILENLGIAYGGLGDLQKQKELMERALTINEAYYGSDHFEVATTLTNLSNAYRALGDSQKMKELLERAVTIYEACGNMPGR